MKKKIFAICLVAIMAITAIAGASLAYLTDRESAENVFTLGNVEIELNETFPENQLLPGIKLKKQATVTNTGINNAYVWVTVAIPVELDSLGDASKNVLHMNVPGAFWDEYYTEQKYIDSAIEKGLLPAGSGAVDKTQTWKVDYEVAENVEIEDRLYNLYAHLYNGILAPEAETTTCLSEVYLDPHVDIAPDGQLYWVEKGVATEIDWNIKDEPNVYVSAYAIQAEGFADVEEAFVAYYEQWGDNGFEFGVDTYPVEDIH